MRVETSHGPLHPQNRFSAVNCSIILLPCRGNVQTYFCCRVWCCGIWRRRASSSDSTDTTRLPKDSPTPFVAPTRTLWPVAAKVSVYSCPVNRPRGCCNTCFFLHHADGIVHFWRVGSPQGGRPIHSSLAANMEVPVTGVHWNPKLPTMLASVNDDGEIRIWGPSSK